MKTFIFEPGYYWSDWLIKKQNYWVRPFCPKLIFISPNEFLLNYTYGWQWLKIIDSFSIGSFQIKYFRIMSLNNHETMKINIK